MYLFALVSILTASYLEFIIIFTIIIIHELGHVIVARLLGVKVKNIYIYPLGGVSKFNMDLNINPIKELLILLGGPLFQFLSLFLIYLFKDKKEVIIIYHYSILLFNLLPIYPLDGGRLINILFQIFISYKRSIKLSIIFSYLLLLIIILKSNLKGNIIIMIIFLLSLIIKESKRINYLYNKFILERYLNNYNFKNSKIINNINNLYRGKKHLIKDNNIYYLEKEYLYKKIKKQS